MNKFYQQPKLLIWLESILFFLLGLGLAILIIDTGYAHPIFYLAFFFYIPISQFLYTPFFKMTGAYTYYSPMLLGYMSNKQQIDLHSGTSFDYLVVMRSHKPGIELRNRLLTYHLEGLLLIISRIEQKHIEESVNIVGTSYFFNERTLQKLGFQLEKASLFYRINLFLNFIDLCWMYSLSQGRWSIPKLWQAKKAHIQGAKLVEQKAALDGLFHTLKAKQKEV